MKGPMSPLSLRATELEDRPPEWMALIAPSSSAGPAPPLPSASSSNGGAGGGLKPRRVRVLPVSHPSHADIYDSGSPGGTGGFIGSNCWAAFWRVVHYLFPCTKWMAAYNLRDDLVADLIAGISVGVMLVPQSMSYAKLAGLPPIYGLYSAFVPILSYVVFGSSRQLAVGPVAIVSILTFDGLRKVVAEKLRDSAVAAGLAATAGGVGGGIELPAAELTGGGVGVGAGGGGMLGGGAGGAVVAGDVSMEELAVLLALMVGLLEVLMGLLRCFFRDFSYVIFQGASQTARLGAAGCVLGETTRERLVGVSASFPSSGAALLVCVSVAKDILSFSMPGQTTFVAALSHIIKQIMAGTELPHPTVLLSSFTLPHPTAGQTTFVAALSHIIKQIMAGKAHWEPMALGGGALLLLLLMKEAGKSWKSLQVLRCAGPFTSIVLGALVVKFWHPPHVPVVGEIPQGLPSLSTAFPWEYFPKLLPTALVITGVAILESCGIAKALAARNGYAIDANQELFGLGMANVLGSFFSSFPTTGELSPLVLTIVRSLCSPSPYRAIRHDSPQRVASAWPTCSAPSSPPLVSEVLPSPPLVSEVLPSPPLVSEVLPSPPLVSEVLPSPPLVSEVLPSPPLVSEVLPSPPLVSEVLPSPPLVSEVLPSPPLVSEVLPSPPLVSEVLPSPPLVSEVLPSPPLVSEVLPSPPLVSEVLPSPPLVSEVLPSPPLVSEVLPSPPLVSEVLPSPPLVSEVLPSPPLVSEVLPSPPLVSEVLPSPPLVSEVLPSPPLVSEVLPSPPLVSEVLPSPPLVSEVLPSPPLVSEVLPSPPLVSEVLPSPPLVSEVLPSPPLVSEVLPSPPLVSEVLPSPPLVSEVLPSPPLVSEVLPSPPLVSEVLPSPPLVSEVLPSPPLVSEVLPSPPLVSEVLPSPPLVSEVLPSPPLVSEVLPSPPLVSEVLPSPPLVSEVLPSPPLVSEVLPSPPLVSEVLPSPPLVSEVLPSPPLVSEVLPSPPLVSEVLPSPPLVSEVLPSPPPLSSAGTSCSPCHHSPPFPFPRTAFHPLHTRSPPYPLPLCAPSPTFPHMPMPPLCRLLLPISSGRGGGAYGTEWAHHGSSFRLSSLPPLSYPHCLSPITAGSFSRSAVNNEVGARTALSGLIMALMVVATLLFLTPAFRDVPQSGIWSIPHVARHGVGGLIMALMVVPTLLFLTPAFKDVPHVRISGSWVASSLQPSQTFLRYAHTSGSHAFRSSPSPFYPCPSSLASCCPSNPFPPVSAGSLQAGRPTGPPLPVAGIHQRPPPAAPAPCLPVPSQCVLAAVVVNAVHGLVDLQEPLFLWRVEKKDLVLWFCAFLGTLLLGLETGVLISVALSLVFVIHESANPHMAVLGRLPGTTVYRNVKQYRDAYTYRGVPCWVASQAPRRAGSPPRHHGLPQPVLGRLPGTTVYRNVKQYRDAYTYRGVVILRIDSPIYFANVDYIKERLRKYELQRVAWWKDGSSGSSGGRLAGSNGGANRMAVMDLRFLILEMSPVTYIDSTAVHALKELYNEYKARDIQLCFSNPSPKVMLTMARAGFPDLIGRQWYFVRIHDAVQVCLALLEDTEITIETPSRYQRADSSAVRATSAQAGGSRQQQPQQQQRQGGVREERPHTPSRHHSEPQQQQGQQQKEEGGDEPRVTQQVSPTPGLTLSPHLSASFVNLAQAAQRASSSNSEGGLSTVGEDIQSMSGESEESMGARRRKKQSVATAAADAADAAEDAAFFEGRMSSGTTVGDLASSLSPFLETEGTFQGLD
ncbi:unnamed protein product [Closterium sp. NIES-65]|nr:unnamed protein product [Closterium sp. NIES-65]